MANVSIPDDFPCIWLMAQRGIQITSAPDDTEIARFDTEQIEFMWADKHFTSWCDADPRYGRDIGGGAAPIYRLVDPEYYTWLRARMENCKAANARGDLVGEKYNLVRDGFNVIHRYVVSHFSTEAIVAAKAASRKPKYLYLPPSASSLVEQKRLWRLTIAANEAPKDPRVTQLAEKLATQGYAQIHVDWTDIPVIILSDGASLESIPRPLRWGTAAFTLQEVYSLRGKPVADVQAICEVKAEYHGARIIQEGAVS